VDAERARRLMLLERGLVDFEREAYFEAHEHWEDHWRVAASPERIWVQGLIQLAAARIKLRGSAWTPAERLAGRALAKLTDAPPRLEGIDIDAARADCHAVVAAARARRIEPALALRARDGT
jgi:predicted metal-dependent hydrolase